MEETIRGTASGYGTLAAAAVTVSEPAVHDRLAALDRAAGDVAGVVSALIDRLGPVLAPQPPELLEAVNAGGPGALHSPLADRIENLRAGLAGTHTRLVRILDALEV